MCVRIYIHIFVYVYIYTHTPLALSTTFRNQDLHLFCNCEGECRALDVASPLGRHPEEANICIPCRAQQSRDARHITELF